MSELDARACGSSEGKFPAAELDVCLPQRRKRVKDQDRPIPSTQFPALLESSFAAYGVVAPAMQIPRHVGMEDRADRPHRGRSVRSTV